MQSEFALFFLTEIATPNHASEPEELSKPKLLFIYFLALVNPPKILATATRIPLFEFILGEMRYNFYIVEKLLFLS